MDKRYHTLKESYAAIQEAKEAKDSIIKNKEDAQKKEHELAESEIEDARDYKKFKEQTLSNYSEKVYDEMMATALKGIYVSSIQECCGGEDGLSKSDTALAERLVDNYIKEAGGAKSIIHRVKGKTYFLTRLCEEVEEAHDDAIEDATEDPDKVEMDEIPDEPKEKMFDNLEKEKDVDDAVEIIADRISNAEEDFIKKNAEDKQKIETIVAGINDRIDGVKADNTISQEDKEAVEQEAALDCKRKTNAVYENRAHSVFETMVQEFSAAIVKDPQLKQQYTNEEGKIDIGNIVGSVKCMYGFLEFVNTTQLEKVDENYIKRVLTEI
jgi:hypothetical protein